MSRSLPSEFYSDDYDHARPRLLLCRDRRGREYWCVGRSSTDGTSWISFLNDSGYAEVPKGTAVLGWMTLPQT